MVDIMLQQVDSSRSPASPRVGPTVSLFLFAEVYSGEARVILPEISRIVHFRRFNSTVRQAGGCAAM
jgi:hypothetical protein